MILQNKKNEPTHLTRKWHTTRSNISITGLTYSPAHKPIQIQDSQHNERLKRKEKGIKGNGKQQELCGNLPISTRG